MLLPTSSEHLKLYIKRESAKDPVLADTRDVE
jgi:hypothetical protein